MAGFIYLVICSLLATICQTTCITPKKSLEKPLVVVSCMYNNAAWATKNLDSVFHQTYENFRMIIVDDGSDDETAEIIETYIETHHLHDKITFIKNKKRKRKLANLYHVMYLINDHEIAIMLDGDDWLAHDNVFNMINEWYDEPIWFTFGQYHNVPESEARHWGWNPRGYANKIPKEVLKSGKIRQDMFRYMHLRTFYGWLFKQIALKDLICLTVKGYQGDFYPASNDLAIYYPIVEMALHHIKFNNEIVYIRNLYSDIVGFKVDHTLQTNAAREIRKKSPYPTLAKPIYRNLEQYRTAPCSVCIICKDHDKETITSYIASINQYLRPGDHIYIIYKESKQTNSWKSDFKKHGNVTSCIAYKNHKTFFDQIYHLIAHDNYEYMLFINPEINLFEVNLSDMIYWLEKTFSYSFLINFNSPKQPYILLQKHIAAASFHFTHAPQTSILDLDFGMLMRKKDVLFCLEQSTNPSFAPPEKGATYLFYYKAQ